MNISDMGFLPGRIMEAIVTTYNTDKSPNAAPIGIYPLGEAEIQMDAHAPSDTRSNLLRTGACVVNVVFDPHLFLKCAILGSAKGEAENEVSKDETIPAENIEAPVLKEANAWIELKMQTSEEKTRRDEHGEMKFSRIVCKVENTGVNKKYPIAINRGVFKVNMRRLAGAIVLSAVVAIGSLLLVRSYLATAIDSDYSGDQQLVAMRWMDRPVNARQYDTDLPPAEPGYVPMCSCAALPGLAPGPVAEQVP